MFCAKCGTKLDDGAAFCHICGERQIPLTQKPQQNTEVEKTMGVFSPETPVPVPPVQINQEAPSQNVSGSVEKTMGVFSQNPATQATQNQGGEIIYIKPGTILHGRYTVGEVLGKGGFGITYIGQDRYIDFEWNYVSFDVCGSVFLYRCRKIIANSLSNSFDWWK